MVTALETVFPGLAGSGYRVTSPATPSYNCIAWAAAEIDVWWWPNPDAEDDSAYWPPNVPREETLEAFVAAFLTLGYTPRATDELEAGFEKIALFAQADGTPTHAARQLSNGNWTSKLGRNVDVEHPLRSIAGEVYGQVISLLQRPIAPYP